MTAVLRCFCAECAGGVLYGGVIEYLADHRWLTEAELARHDVEVIEIEPDGQLVMFPRTAEEGLP